MTRKTFFPYLLLIGGTAATIAANWAHASNNVGAKLLSAVVPVLLLIAFHVSAKDARLRVRLLTGAVALGAFVISFDHISALARRYGETQHSALIYPWVIDGAMVVATWVLSRQERPQAPPEPQVHYEPAPVLVAAPVTTEQDERVVTNEEFVKENWSGGALYVVPESDRTKIVRRMVSKFAQDNGRPAISQGSAEKLIRMYEQEYPRDDSDSFHA